MPGRTLAHYEIDESLGKGGMGEVFRARDTRLNRDVALKVLPEAFAADAQRLGRFAREARVLASLNHPNIAAVHGLEEDGTSHALVMELIEGETLEERMARGSVPVEEVARIGLDLARAMEFAHERGIVHRDLKPANVMIDAEGRLKVLDFGLAKALEEERPAGSIADSPTLTAAATQAGLILGTAAYMAPEQAAGSSVDRRADIWSYGVVLFELLSGRRQFEGETVSHTLASVLKDEPDWNRLPADLPPRVVELLRRCLRKDPSRRLQAIGEARVLWEEFVEDPDSFVSPEDPAGGEDVARPRRALRMAPWALAATALAALVFVTLRDGGTGTAVSADAISPHLTIPVRGNTDLFENETAPPTVSPDGRFVAYGMRGDRGIDQLWLRPLDDFEARPIDNTSGAHLPFWSPDGRHLGFFVDGRLSRIEISTGRSQTIGGEEAFLARGASWTSNDQILFAPNSNTGIWVVDAGGAGSPRQLTTPDPEVADSSHRWPYALPDGNLFLFLFWTNDAEELSEHGGIYLASIDGSLEPRRILPDTSSAAWVPSGHLLVMQNDDLVAVPFDLDRLEVSGEAFIVTQGVLRNRNNGHAAFSASTEGTLVFARGLESVPSASIAWMNRTGEPSETSIDPLPMFPDLRLSPDETRAVTTLPGPTGDPEVWVLDLERGVRSRLTPSAPWTFDDPIWSPDGDRILYISARTGTWDLYTRNADGSGEETSVVQSSFDKQAPDWRGDRIVYWRDEAGVEGVVVVTHDVSTGESTELFEVRAATTRLRFSPDGRLLLYDELVDGRSEVFVREIRGGARWQVSTEGGRLSHWGADGREIVYLDPAQRVMAVDVAVDGSAVKLGRPEALFQISQDVVAWDATDDHDRFLIATRPERTSEPFRVILGWQQGR